MRSELVGWATTRRTQHQNNQAIQEFAHRKTSNYHIDLTPTPILSTYVAFIVDNMIGNLQMIATYRQAPAIDALAWMNRRVEYLYDQLLATNQPGWARKDSYLGFPPSKKPFSSYL